MTTPIDTAYVRIVPEFSRFGPQVAAGVKQASGGFTTLDNRVKQSTTATAGRFATMTTGVKGSFAQVKSSYGTMAAGAAGALAAVKVVQWFRSAITAASDMNESLSKSKVVFGPFAADIEQWSKSSATAMGISSQAAIESAATFGNFFLALGIGQPKAEKMSKSVVQLAADLASFNNEDPTEVLMALRSGLAGEVEPLRRFGIDLSDVALRQEAMNLGLTTSTKSVLPANIKAQAAYSLILKQTKTAQGDFARTSGGLANQQRIVAAEFENAKEKVGRAFLPMMIQIEHLISAVLIPALTAGGQAVSQVFGGAWLVLSPILSGVLGTLRGVSTVIHENEATVKTVAISVAAMWIAWKGYTIVAGAVKAIQGFKVAGSVLDGVRLRAMYAGESLRGLSGASIGAGAAVAGIGIAVAIGTMLWQRHQQKVAETKQAIKTLSDALRENNGVLNQNVRETIVNQAAQDGLLHSLDAAGVSAKAYFDALLTGGPALQQMRDNLASQIKVLTDAGVAQSKYGHATTEQIAGLLAANQLTKEQADALLKDGAATDANADKLDGLNKALAALGGPTGTLGNANTLTNRLALAQKDAKLTASALGQEVATTNRGLKQQASDLGRLAGAMGTSVGGYQAAVKAAKDHAQSTRDETVAMRAAGDTAGLLKQALDALAGKTLSVGEANTAWHSAITGAEAALKENGNTIAINTAKGQANRQNIEGMTRANRSYVDAQLQGVTSGRAANKIIDQANADFKTNAARIYGAKSEAYAYALQIGHIPRVATTDVDLRDDEARRKARDLLAYLNGIKPNAITVAVVFHNQGLNNQERVMLGLDTGAWRIKRDQIAMVHKDEMVIPAIPARRLRAGAGARSVEGPPPLSAGGAQPSGATDGAATVAAFVRALSGMAISFDGDGLARLVTRHQGVADVRGVRR